MLATESETMKSKLSALRKLRQTIDEMFGRRRTLAVSGQSHCAADEFHRLLDKKVADVREPTANHIIPPLAIVIVCFSVIIPSMNLSAVRHHAGWND